MLNLYYNAGSSIITTHDTIQFSIYLINLALSIA